MMKVDLFLHRQSDEDCPVRLHLTFGGERKAPNIVVVIVAARVLFSTIFHSIRYRWILYP